MSYVCWVVAHNLTFLSLVYVAERACALYSQSTIIAAVNLNQLPYFILSSVLCGLVNISIYTLYYNDWAAVSIVILHQAVVTAVVYGLYSKGIRLKNW